MVKPVYVTQPALPPLAELQPYLERIWATGHLTNCGPLHQELESRLATLLDVPHVALFNNGTMALIAALKALDLTGEVITTPYSFIATAHAISMAGLSPVFVDVAPETGNLDPAMIESAITPRTCAILPVHCYGEPCDHQRIHAVAQKHGLKVIYDAAHTFGATDQGGSISRYGDMAALSLHATKVLHTFEGGAVVSHDHDSYQRLCRFRNFGIAGETEIPELGLNGKMSEVCAAMGLVQLPHLDAMLGARKQIVELYEAELRDVDGIQVLNAALRAGSNYSYMPIVIDPKRADRDTIYSRLSDQRIFARRYFYPLISHTKPYADARHRELPNAEALCKRILCLPLSSQMTSETAQLVIQALKHALNTA